MIQVHNLKKKFDDFQALNGVEMHVGKGDIYGLVGPNGAGKTTLLNILASLDKPTNGEILLNGKNTVQIKDKELSAFRRDNLGFRISICLTHLL